MTGRRVVLLAALPVFLAAPLTFFVVGLTEGLSPADTLAALAAQYAADRLNLLVCSLLALFPLLLLLLILWIGGRFGKLRETGGTVALGGVIPVVAVTFFANFQYWPVFLPTRVYPGFPHGLELVLGPGIAAPLAMLVGMLVARLTIRRPA